MTNHTAADVTANFAAAAGLLRPNPYLSPLFRNPGVPHASGAGPPIGRDCESDSGASSADLDDEVRSGSALSYLKPSGSPLSDRVGSDSECFAKNVPKPIHLNNNHLKSVPLGPPLPPTSPNKWFPPPFPVMPGDPAVWRELWLRGQPSVVEPAPDQDQPIDLSVKPGCKGESPTGEGTSNEIEASKAPAPLDLTLAER